MTSVSLFAMSSSSKLLTPETAGFVVDRITQQFLADEREGTTRWC